MSALTVQKLSCFYQENQVLDSLDLELKDNEIVCLLGESGCGKTTLLKAIAGLQQDLSGKIKINEKTVNDNALKMAPEKRKVGFIFQDHALFPHLNVFDNVAFSLSKLGKQDKKNRVGEVLSLVRLEQYAQRFPHQLSGGQQQRVAIARALAYQPDLMLLDEPFSNLDHHVRFTIIHEIRTLLKAHSLSALLVTHSKEEGFAFADKIALMQAGKIVQIGSPQALYNHPDSKYVADFMGHSNYLKVQVKDNYHYQSDFGLLTSSTSSGFAPGTQLTLLLRPEQMTISGSESGFAVIKQIDFLGAYQHITVSCQEQDYLIKQGGQSTGDAFFRIGDRVSLTVSHHDFVTFNGE